MTFAFGLIGHPIQHSLSPWIHEQFLKRTGQKGTYTIFEIPLEDSFQKAMDELRKQNLDGFNVTVPYKEKIIEYLDELDPYAEKIGAVNTVQCKNGRWTGYNTDGIGYVRSLESKFRDIQTNKAKSILILGAGGAAKGIYHALVKGGYTSITIANRTVDKATSLTGQHSGHKAITLETAAEMAHQYDVIIQTSSVGMKPMIDEVIIPLTKIKSHAMVSDIVYQPLMTQFLQDAKELGAQVHFGHTMLLYQAQYAFKIWTGLEPNMEQLDDALQIELEG